MAAAVESSTSNQRYYCHLCNQNISPTIPEYTCPECHSGFIEELNNEDEMDADESNIRHPEHPISFLMRNNETGRNEIRGRTGRRRRTFMRNRAGVSQDPIVGHFAALDQLLRRFGQGGGNSLQRSDRNKRKKENDVAAPVGSLTGMLLDNGDSEGSEDDDWKAGDKRKIKKKQTAGKKSKQKPENGESKTKDIDSNDSPSKLNSSKTKQKNLKRKSCDADEGEDADEGKDADDDVSQDAKLNIAPDHPISFLMRNNETGRNEIRGRTGRRRRTFMRNRAGVSQDPIVGHFAGLDQLLRRFGQGGGNSSMSSGEPFGGSPSFLNFLHIHGIPGDYAWGGRGLDSIITRKDCPAQKELPGGLIIEDLVKGEGKKAKKGRQVSVYYKGCLKKTMKEFDSCLKGKPFTFRVGKGEVIKGWDIGVEGMQIGGKRRLTVPPSLAYGSKQMGSSIPANSTLIFVVELLKVN